MAASCALFHFVVWGAIGGVICCFGFIGNFLSLVAFQTDRRSPTTTLLQCLASSDFVLLIGVFITDALPYTCDFTGLCRNIWGAWPYIRYVWFFIPISHMCSIWFVVLIAGNRYWAVCQPHTMQRVWHNTRTTFYVVMVLLVVLVFNIPRFFEYTIVKTEQNFNGTETWKLEENKTSFGLTHSYKVVYKVMLVNILLILLPIVLLIVMTTLILITLRRTRLNKKKRASALAKNKNEKSSKKSRKSGVSSSEITIVLVTVVVVTIVCQTPLAVFHFVRYSFRYGCGDIVFYLNNISKLLININSCVNFVIYCLLSRKFRTLLCSALCCKKGTEIEARVTRRDVCTMTPIAKV